jgi:hypothetical protein
MRTRAVLLSVALCGSCASAPKAVEVKTNGIKHALFPVEGGADEPVVAIFEQTLCSQLFELNDKQVVCGDDMKTMIAAHRDRAILTGGTSDGQPLEELQKSFEAPRRLAVRFAKSGGVPVFSTLVQGREGAALGRFETRVKADGSDVLERCRELASQVLALPK